MGQQAVDAYLALFDRVAVDDATFYVSNAHDYVFTGDWNYPAGWRRLFCANTPRSWTRDHPTEIFARAPGDRGDRGRISPQPAATGLSRSSSQPAPATVALKAS
jgi:hypothetical protein